jgi:Cu(I)/Ag(I) efflux system membrane protein CusA/SilA
VYLDNAFREYQTSNRLNNYKNVKAAIMESAVLRVRPKAKTVAVIIAGLLPIMHGHGTGSEVMPRIAAQIVGV